MVHRLLLLTLLLGCTVFLGCTASRATTGFDAVMALPLRSSDGEPTDLARVLAGRPAVVVLTASWCEACRRERPRLERLRAASRATGDFLVVDIAIDEAPRPGEAQSFFDAAGAFARLGPRVVPTTLVLDRRGLVAFVGGALDRRAIDALTRTRAPEAGGR